MTLTLTPRNKLYDGGDTVHSKAAQQAFARYAGAIAKRFPCVVALEIGNEINDHSLKGPILSQLPEGYVALLQTVRTELTDIGRPVFLLSGSTLSVATGFIDTLLAGGLADVIDGIAIHPYVATPEHLRWQIARLHTIVATRSEKPLSLYANEIGGQFSNPADAAIYALKAITILSAAGVDRTDWYALREQSFFPGMGLYVGTSPRPAVSTIQMLVRDLLPAGEAQRMESGDRLTSVYRFGQGRFVVWGPDRAMTWPVGARAWNAVGQPISLPQRLSDAPVVIESSGNPQLGPVTSVADSWIDPASPGWSYAIRDAVGTEQPLEWIDWKWTPFLGRKGRPGFRVMPNVVTVGHGKKREFSLVERFRPPHAGQYRLSGCFAVRVGESVQLEVVASGKTAIERTISGSTTIEPIPIALMSGETIEVRYFVEGSKGGFVGVRRRITITTTASNDPAPSCPAERKDRDTQAGLL